MQKNKKRSKSKQIKRSEKIEVKKVKSKPVKTRKKSFKRQLEFLKKLINKYKVGYKREKVKKTKLEVDRLKKTIYVKDIMTKNPVTINFNEPISHAFELMEKYGLYNLIVTKNNMPIGVIDDYDITTFLSSFVDMKKGAIEGNKKKIEGLLRKPISAAMNKVGISIGKMAPLEEAIRLINVQKMKLLPVVDGKKLVGVLQERDILNLLEKETESQESIKSKILETGIDKLLDLINKYDSITSKDAASSLGVSTSKIEKWARILQSHELIDIDFSKIGVIRLIKKKKDFF